MNHREDLIRRIEFLVPQNPNTHGLIENLEEFLSQKIGGYTKLQTSEGGGFFDDGEDNRYYETTFLYIVYIESNKIGITKYLDEFLTQLLVFFGEKEGWMISDTAELMVCAKTKN